MVSLSLGSVDAPNPVAPEAPGDVAVGEVLSERWVLVQRLAMGGMGEVWQARHATLGTRVAVKLLRPHVRRREGAHERFFREARILATLGTRRAVAVHDFGVTRSGAPFLVMELVDGESLSERLRRERVLSPELVTRVLSQAARALGRAHALGVAHLDFKPDNVLLGLDEDGRLDVKVADFGVAQMVGEPQDGALVGTLAYMAPEQLSGAPIGAAADVWAFGIVAYECLTGVHPFEGASGAGLVARVRAVDMEPPSRVRAELPSSIDEWVARACALDPALRFASVKQAAMELGDALAVFPEPDDTRPHTRAPEPRRGARGPWVLAGVAVSMLTAGVYVGVSLGATNAALSTSVALPAEAEPASSAVARPDDVAPRPVQPPSRAPSPVTLPSYRDMPDGPEPTRQAGWKADPYR